MTPNDGRFRPGHTVNETHGGSGAVRRMGKGLPFTGKAAEIALVVRQELEDLGKAPLAAELVVKSMAALRLYWQAFLSAADAGDVEKMDSYLKRLGWLIGVAGRSLDRVKEHPDALDLPTLLSQEVGDAANAGD